MTNNWTEICAKCRDGDVEPKNCEYYGEPNGCNSPIYGEHPAAENSSVVGDAAKLREAMKRIVAASIVAKNANAPEWILQRMADIFAMATTALAEPPRNCDVGTAEEQEKRYNEWLNADVGRAVLGLDPLEWAQMPYEEGGAQ